KRRNVFRVGAAYGIVAWVLIEVAHTAFPTLQLPDWTTTLVTVLLIMGFPVALVIAWAFELTPEGIKRETAVDPADSVRHATGRRLDFVIIGLLVLAVAYFAVDKFILESEPEQAEITPKPLPVAEAVVREKSIAVLPFVNMSSDPEQEYFSDGLSEEILNLLAKIPGLKVIGRTSSFAFKGKNEDLRVIGATLDVSTVLEGSVRKSGERVRITAQLIDVSNGAHLWSETYDRTIIDIFAVQDDVASSIIEALKIHVSAAPTRGRPTDNSEAYSLFLKARAALNAFDIQASEDLLLEVIELDPRFAEAHQQLAYHYWMTSGLLEEASISQKRVYDAATSALAVDPSLLLADALRISGSLDNVSWLAEIEALERITREEPSNADASGALVWDLLDAGYFRDALGLAEHFVELDPLSAFAHVTLATAQFSVGQMSEADQSMLLAGEFGFDGGYWALGRLALSEQRDEEAITHFEAAQRRLGQPSGWVRELVTGARNPETGQAYLDQHIPRIAAALPEEVAFEAVRVLHGFYLNFGFVDRYFEILFSFDLRPSVWSEADRMAAEGLRDRESGFTKHPRFLEVAEANGLLILWERRGPPDFCEKLDGQWVCE
ncbi:MAG: hypothetical protein JRD03_02245, partial [Deltaproteobacteria bacterium]|nr:hypothetical protein [Deltaproteobacteria bacterium]